MKALALLVLPALGCGAPLSISAPPDAALVTPHRIEVLGLLNDRQIGVAADFIRAQRVADAK
jgi:hypothetical protein